MPCASIYFKVSILNLPLQYLHLNLPKEIAPMLMRIVRDGLLLGNAARIQSICLEVQAFQDVVGRAAKLVNSVCFSLPLNQFRDNASNFGSVFCIVFSKLSLPSLHNILHLSLLHIQVLCAFSFFFFPSWLMNICTSHSIFYYDLLGHTGASLQVT